ELAILGVQGVRDIVCSYVWHTCCVRPPDKTLSSFTLHTCDFCKLDICNECVTGCDDCKVTYCCEDCMKKNPQKCHCCKGFVCQNCVLECCGKNFCNDCV